MADSQLSQAELLDAIDNAHADAVAVGKQIRPTLLALKDYGGWDIEDFHAPLAHEQLVEHLELLAAACHEWDPLATEPVTQQFCIAASSQNMLPASIGAEASTCWHSAVVLLARQVIATGVGGLPCTVEVIRDAKGNDTLTPYFQGPAGFDWRAEGEGRGDNIDLERQWMWFWPDHRAINEPRPRDEDANVFDALPDAMTKMVIEWNVARQTVEATPPAASELPEAAETTPEVAPEEGTLGEPKPAKAPRVKRSASKGEARIKLIAALTQHHDYEAVSCLNQEPIGCNALAKLAEVSKGSASSFFCKEFGAHAKYCYVCGDVGKLAESLQLLNQELTPQSLLKYDPPGEDGRDIEITD